MCPAFKVMLDFPNGELHFVSASYQFLQWLPTSGLSAPLRKSNGVEMSFYGLIFIVYLRKNTGASSRNMASPGVRTECCRWGHCLVRHAICRCSVVHSCSINHYGIVLFLCNVGNTVRIVCWVVWVVSLWAQQRGMGPLASLLEGLVISVRAA